MNPKKNILVIIGSASKNSSNRKLVDLFVRLTNDCFISTIFEDLKSLPHFDPELTLEHPPAEIVDLRLKIQQADALVICTPEYVFSLPSGLKNAIEWCVASTVFSDKPTGLITASADGRKAHEELQLIMKTVMCRFTDETTLLINGIKGKMSAEGEIKEASAHQQFLNFIDAFKRLVVV